MSAGSQPTLLRSAATCALAFSTLPQMNIAATAAAARTHYRDSLIDNLHQQLGLQASMSTL